MTRLRLDLRFVEIEREIAALLHFVNQLEGGIQQLIDQDRVKTEREIRGAHQAWDEPEIRMAHDALEDRAVNVYPRMMRGPFVVLLWACYESAVYGIARERQGALNARLALKNIRGEHFLDAALRYFAAVLNEPLDTDDDRLRQLEDLLIVRHVIAHGNGQAHLINKTARRRLASVLQRTPTLGLDDEYLRISHQFLLDCYDAVDMSLSALIDRIRGPSVRVVGEA